MLRALSTFLNSSILWIVLNAAQDILFVALLYLTLIPVRTRGSIRGIRPSASYF
jgi:hypothetical protein